MLYLEGEPLNIKVADIHLSSFVYFDGKNNFVNGKKNQLELWNSSALQQKSFSGLSPEGLGQRINSELGLSFSPCLLIETRDVR